MCSSKRKPRSKTEALTAMFGPYISPGSIGPSGKSRALNMNAKCFFICSIHLGGGLSNNGSMAPPNNSYSWLLFRNFSQAERNEGRGIVSSSVMTMSPPWSAGMATLRALLLPGADSRSISRGSSARKPSMIFAVASVLALSTTSIFQPTVGARTRRYPSSVRGRTASPLRVASNTVNATSCIALTMEPRTVCRAMWKRS